MSMTSESDEMMVDSDVDLPSVDDANSSGGGRTTLKKGPWTAQEDAILVDYVTQNGEGNWNAVQKSTGLARCGKSCRLRWTNHLRPNLKKGAFTPEEEQYIIELHAQMGNKWARMAAKLPGRTDNEIKNFWNTRIKRLQRSGLPIYPPNINLKASNENQQSESMSTLLSSANVHHANFLPVNELEAPKFKSFMLNKPMYPPPTLNIPPSNPLIPTSSHQNKYFLPTVPVSEPVFPSSSIGISNPFLGGNQFGNSMQISQSVVQSSLLNGNVSLAMKPELPSLQNQTGQWGPPFPSPPYLPFRQVDILTECDQLAEDSGLLESLLYEAELMNNPKGNYIDPMSMMANPECEMYDDELSSLCQSSSSVLSTSTPLSGTSLDEFHSASTFPGYVKEEANVGSMLYNDRVESMTNQMDFSGPDFLPGSNQLDRMDYDNCLLKEDDAIEAFFVGDDLSRGTNENEMGGNANPGI